MRKILSGFLATSMIVAVASSVTFAANATITISPNNVLIRPDFQEDTINTVSTIDLTKNTVDATVTFQQMSIDVTTNDGSGTIVVPLNNESVTKKLTYDSGDIVAVAGTTKAHVPAKTAVQVMSVSDVQKMLVGKKFSSVKIGQKLYSGTIVAVPNTLDVMIKFDDAAMGTITSVNWGLEMDIDYDADNLVLLDTAGKPVSYHPISAGFTGENGVATYTSASNNQDLSDVEKSGLFDTGNFEIEDVIICDGDGRPVPMTETGSGVDKDVNGENGIQSGQTLYFMINDDVVPTFADDTFWKLKVTKGDNSKMIKAINDVTKTFSKPLYNAYYGNPISNINFSKRHRYIKVELNEVYTDDEYKITLDARLSPKTKAVEKFDDVTDDSEFKVKDFYFYMKNIVKAADNDWRVGIEGLMLNPLENDWNEVTYFDEDGDVAFMKFFADSDVGKFYSKLSTKWEHADYASYFNDQDAFIFNFTGSPKISSTSRCDLQIYNPFLNEDGNETIDPSTAVVYQVIDGDLYDVTDSFKYEEGDNGDMAFTTRTRFLGTYIICEKAVEEAVADETVPDELTPDTDTTAPVETTPDTSNNGKTPANTGKYL